MQRSFKLKFFLMVTVAIVLFAIFTRISVRNASFKPLHEMQYVNFAGYLELTVKDTTKSLPELTQQIGHYFLDPHLSHLQVWRSDSENEVQRHMLSNTLWRNLNDAKRPFAVQIAEATFKDQVVVIFKLKQDSHDLYVAVQSGVFQEKFEEIMGARESIVNSMWPILLVYIVSCTWFLTYWVTRSLQNLQNTFKDIELKGQGNTLSDKQFDLEFASFVNYFNSLIQRLQLNYAQASRFSSDAAHELRTPLTVIRGNLKRLLNRAPNNSVEQIQLSMLSDEVERLISITNKLVLLSQADGDNFKLSLQPVKLFDLIALTGENIQNFAPHIQFEYSLSPDLQVLADPNLFQQLLSNLVSNAIKYTSPQGQVKFTAKEVGDTVKFSMANTTYLSLEGLDERIFQRFYRHLSEPGADIQRPKGDGLGLSLCQEITRVHGGTLTLHKGPGQWVSFTVTWQRA
jgi:signal transduction histidine kinase